MTSLPRLLGVDQGAPSKTTMGQYEQPPVVVVGGAAAPPPAYTPVVQSTAIYTSPGSPFPQGSPQFQMIQAAPAPIMPIPDFSTEPTYAPCHVCRQTVGTKTEKEIGGCTYLAAAIMCMTCLGCFACIPFCMDSCKDTKHRCSRCNTYLGIHQRL